MKNKGTYLIFLTTIFLNCGTNKLTTLDNSDDTKDTTSIVTTEKIDTVINISSPIPAIPTIPNIPDTLVTIIEVLQNASSSIESSFDQEVEQILTSWDTSTNQTSSMLHSTEDGKLSIQTSETNTSSFVLNSKDTVLIDTNTVYFEVTIQNIKSEKFTYHGLDVGLMLTSMPGNTFTFNKANKEVYGLGFNWRPDAPNRNQVETLMLILERDTIADLNMELKLSELSEKTLKFQMVYSGSTGEYIYRILDVNSDKNILLHKGTRSASNNSTLAIEDKIFAHVMLYANKGAMTLSNFNTYLVDKENENTLFSLLQR